MDAQRYIANGETLVTAAGTAEALMSLPDDHHANLIKIKALSGNTGAVYVGDASVSSANGYPLAANDELELPLISNRAMPYLDAETNGEGVRWIVLGS